MNNIIKKIIWILIIGIFLFAVVRGATADTEDKIVKTTYNLTIQDCNLKIKTEYSDANIDYTIQGCDVNNTATYSATKDILFFTTMECNRTITQEWLDHFSKGCDGKDCYQEYVRCKESKQRVMDEKQALDSEKANWTDETKRLTDLTVQVEKINERALGWERSYLDCNKTKFDLEIESEGRKNNFWFGGFLFAGIVLIYYEVIKKKFFVSKTSKEFPRRGEYKEPPK